jgi:tRNA A37 N6-isopentenylltransferase MiaA
VQVPVLIKQHTRNYAKRQLTWMRRYENVHYLNPLATESLLLQALDRIG